MFTEDLVRSTIQCVHFTKRSQLPDTAEVSKRGVAVAEMDAAGIRTDQQLFAIMAKALHFPEWFGMNWDAANDCLRDLEWLHSNGCVLILHHARKFWNRAPALAGQLVESWLFCVAFWLEQGAPFHLIFLLDED